MTVFDQISSLLEKNGIAYKSLEHEPTKTCEDSARIRGTSTGQGAKALVVIADKKPIMITLPCSKRLDSKLFKDKFGIKDLRFATPEEVKDVTGLEIGSIPPWGSLFDLPTYMDKALGENTQIAFNAGELTKSIIMDFSDFVALEQPTAW